ncbi:MAG: DUF4178 domain-containing protein [Verrucomicrobia bacterium]|nr:DUF4178 domain-containing protein [Verrucomicrobiota bacterium]
MDFQNPTPLKLGATGTLAGRRFRVVGRVVMGVEEDGESYFWNEFNVVDDGGHSATLVFETTENGVEWRLFTLFEPTNPISVQEAATKRVGDSVNLDGRPCSVTLVSQSCVDFIEGQAPEGVELGDVANYFNAGPGNHQIVVSWTGNEVECYRGIDLPAGVVSNAFGLPKPVPSVTAIPTRPNNSSGISGTVTSVAMFALYVWFSIGDFSCSGNRAPRRAAAIVKPPTPVSPLFVGAEGMLAGKIWRIRKHTVVEITAPRARFDRHEYQLAAADGSTAVLLHWLTPNERDWHLLLRAQAEPELTPQQAATRKPGDALTVDGRTARIADLYVSRVQFAEDTTTLLEENGVVAFHFLARAGKEIVVVDWTERGIQFLRGRSVRKSEVEAAFLRTPAKTK